MEEQQATIDGETKPMDNPFLVIATQNPVEIQGTFPLPEAQLDRFTVRLKLGYPNTAEGVTILSRFKENNPLVSLSPVCSKSDIQEAQLQYVNVHINEDLLRYIVNIAEATRSNPDVVLGVSPRGTQALLRASQAYAILQGRSYVIPDDIKALAIPVMSHRIILKGALRLKSGANEELINSILNRLPVPSEDHLSFCLT
jgi:MoxR-like ATPase